MSPLFEPRVRASAFAVIAACLALGGCASDNSSSDGSGDAQGSGDTQGSGDAQGSGEGSAPPLLEYDASIEAGPTAARRLTHAQYENVLYDVFGPELVIAELAEPDVVVSGLAAVGASAASFSARGVESLEEASYALAEQAIETPEIRARVVDCDLADDGCAESIVGAVGRRLWRRPLTDDELSRMMGIADEAGAALESAEQGLVYALAALLQSPNFTYRIELGEAQGDSFAFTDLEFANRLAFFLWNTAPDDTLLDAALAGELSTDEGLRAQAERMVEDPRARRGMRAFFTDFLELEELDHLAKDPTLYEHFSTLLGPDAREETLLLWEHFVFDAELDYRDMLTTRETFVNPRLAALYDIPAPVREGFGYVQLPDDGGRAGLLGHASLLNLHGHPRSTSATLRGAAIRKTLLCQTIPPPPVDVDTSIPEPSGDVQTLRDRVAEHLENESCAGCHNLMDPIGLGLENFDGVGRWRDTDRGFDIDASGELDGVYFGDALELGAAIRERGELSRCLVRTLGRYASGRVETRDEMDHIWNLDDRFASHAYRVKPLLVEIVMSPLFRNAGAPQ